MTEHRISLLASDGTYEQSFGEGRTEPAVINRGRRRLEAGGFWDGTQVRLDDMVEVYDPFGRRGSMKREAGMYTSP